MISFQGDLPSMAEPNFMSYLIRHCMNFNHVYLKAIERRSGVQPRHSSNSAAEKKQRVVIALAFSATRLRPGYVTFIADFVIVAHLNTMSVSWDRRNTVLER